MARNMMQIDGVPPETRARLKALALERFGKANASLMVRHLVDECLEKTPGQALAVSGLDVAGETVRVELRLPRPVLQELEKVSDSRLSPRNYYIVSLIYRQLGIERLLGDQIEVLRQSNFQLSKVGTNLNQMTRAFNILVRAGAGGRPPEIGKKMASLRTEIRAHIAKVIKALDSGAADWEKKVPAPGRKRVGRVAK